MLYFPATWQRLPSSERRNTDFNGVKVEPVAYLFLVLDIDNTQQALLRKSYLVTM